MNGGNAPHHYEHGSPVVRALFFIAGIVSLGFAIAGIFLPVLPTTPLVLLAATCFARSYRPFHEWLIAHRLFGPILREWHEHRSIPYRSIAMHSLETAGHFELDAVLRLWLSGQPEPIELTLGNGKASSQLVALLAEHSPR